MTEHRFNPGKEWGSKARKEEDTPGRKAQERRAVLDEWLEDRPDCEVVP